MKDLNNQKVADLQKELNQIPSNVSAERAKQVPLENRAQQSQAENVRRHAKIQQLKDDHLAQMQEARHLQVQVYNFFPTSPVGMDLATAYRVRLVWQFLRSGHFLSEASKFVVYYVQHAIAIAQANLTSSGIHVNFDSNFVFGRIL